MRMTSKLTLVLAVPYVTRFVIQMPLFLAGRGGLLGVAKVVLGWPLLIAALAVMGVMLPRAGPQWRIRRWQIGVLLHPGLGGRSEDR